MKVNTERMRLRMLKLVFDARALAAATGLSVSTVNKALRGGIIRPLTVGKISKALEVDPAALILEDTRDEG